MREYLLGVLAYVFVIFFMSVFACVPNFKYL